MKFKTQAKTLSGMEIETRRAMRALEDKHVVELEKLWAEAKDELEQAIMAEYRRDFGRGPWDVTQANQRGTLSRIHARAGQILKAFHDQAHPFIKQALRDHRDTECLRAAWMLDQVTPPSYKAGVPFRSLHEAGAPDAPGDFPTSWSDTLANWLRAYQDALASNLRMEALHGGSLHDAADEVDAARIDNFDPTYKLRQLLASEIIQAQQDARSEVADANEDMAADEVWLTLEDSSVCEECDSYEGKSLSVIHDEPPAHFNCRCYTAVVPKPWAKMLAGGNEDERLAARRVDELGLVPQAMVITDANGMPVATVTVSFDDWAAQNAHNIVAGRLIQR